MKALTAEKLMKEFGAEIEAFVKVQNWQMALELCDDTQAIAGPYYSKQIDEVRTWVRCHQYEEKYDIGIFVVEDADEKDVDS